ncbi:CLUMA_CG020464, isoform B [Clunio marinus]|uniref:CLUMA_CG020464, isoform B n=1 Tax=Clunio marinus TaxID=568069 RepID=A0A1J1J926_9DIPT|nr:CLUMA_CG020464, isoform B [Clunio marinus]
MKGLTILLFATVIASSDAAQKCEEVTDPCASVRAAAAPIYENANNTYIAVQDRCTPQLEAADSSEELDQIYSQCTGELSDALRNVISALGDLVGINPPENYIKIAAKHEENPCLAETDFKILSNYDIVTHHFYYIKNPDAEKIKFGSFL